MILNVVVTVVFLILAIALIVVGALAATGKLPGNSVVGLRIPEVRKEESIWTQAHKVAGPFWVLSGVALVFGAAFAWIASGFVWIAPIVALIVAVVFISVGANFGARAAVLVDNAIEQQQNEPPAAKPAPKVDMDALRRAAKSADDKSE